MEKKARKKGTGYWEKDEPTNRECWQEEKGEDRGMG
jgi:hypothetical protein